MDRKTIITGIAAAAFIGGLIFFSSGKERSETKDTTNQESKEKIYFEEAVGQKAPDFELESIDGGSVKLSDYLGKSVVLFFNEGSMCYPACWDQIAELGNDSRFDAEGAVAFSIVIDPKSQWREIVSKSSNLKKSKILFDTARSVSKAYDVLNLNSCIAYNRVYRRNCSAVRALLHYGLTAVVFRLYFQGKAESISDDVRIFFGPSRGVSAAWHGGGWLGETI